MVTQTKALCAEIVTTGTEILLGEIVDTNAAWIARRLRDTGVNLYFKTTVGDNEDRMRGVLELGLSRSDVLIITGGLGPTVDDITRQAIAAAAGVELVLDEEALVILQARFDRFGVKMTENNKQQAMIPKGATSIPNPVGTAPGFIVETGHGTMIAIPGVPREMKRLMKDTVLPYLVSTMGQQAVIRRLILRTIGIGESTLDNLLGDLMRGNNPTVGLAAKTAQADIRVAARAETEAEADAMIDSVSTAIYQLVDDTIYSETADEPIESIVVRMLADKGQTVALLESNTGGILAQRISAIKQGESVLSAAHVTMGTSLPDRISDAIPEISTGTDPQQIVRVARALQEQYGADYAIAILGSSEPNGGMFGTDSSSTWLALIGNDIEEALMMNYGGADEFTIARIGNQALALLWKTLK